MISKFTFTCADRSSAPLPPPAMQTAASVACLVAVLLLLGLGPEGVGHTHGPAVLLCDFRLPLVLGIWTFVFLVRCVTISHHPWWLPLRQIRVQSLASLPYFRGISSWLVSVFVHWDSPRKPPCAHTS